MWSRIRIQPLVDKLEISAWFFGAAGGLVGGFWGPLAMLKEREVRCDIFDVAEAAIAIPVACVAGAGVGAFAGACFGGTLPVTVPVFAYHFGRQMARKKSSAPEAAHK